MQRTRLTLCNLVRTFCVVLLLTAAVTAVAAPQLPKAGLDWKNIGVGTRKTAVFDIFRDHRGLMWLGTNDGLYFYDGVNTRHIESDELAGTQIHDIAEYDGRLYLGTNNGLVEYDFTTGALKPAGKDYPREIRTLLLVDHTLWMGSLVGLYTLDLKTGKLTKRVRGLPHYSVYSLLRDSRGIIYAGTYGGIARYDNGADVFRQLTCATDSDVNRLFANTMLETEDGSGIYIGSEGSLHLYTPANESWTRVPALESFVVKSLARGKDGHILAGTDNGVFDISGTTVTHHRHDTRDGQSLADNEIWSVYSDPEQNIWAGHERGFSVASNSQTMRTVRLNALSDSGEGNEIYNMLRDGSGNLWLGGSNGVIRLTGNKGARWYRHGDRKGALSHNRIRAISNDSGGDIWLATDAGINRYNPATAGFDIFHVTDRDGGHVSNWVYTLVEDGDSYWIGGFLNGMHRVAKDRLRGGGGTVVSDFALNSDTRVGGRPVLANDLVNNAVTDAAGNLWILLFRDSALTCYDVDGGKFRHFDIHRLSGQYPQALARDRRGRVWCAFSGGVMVFDSDGSYRLVRFPHTGSDEGVLAMGAVGGGGMWISTLSNVWNIDGKTLRPSMLPIPQKPYTAIYQDPVDGEVLLGGTDELLTVDPRGIADADNFRRIRMILADDNGGRGHVNLLDASGRGTELTLPYGGSVTLRVSNLNYSPGAVQRYMYKLARNDADTAGNWTVLPEGANTIRLSDLNMGGYRILVKAVGSPLPAVSVPLSVRPPFWLSRWAVLIYILLLGAVVWAIVWYMRRKAMAEMAERERRTALDNVERKLVFLSSISHDLKTPLSMIMGPVSRLRDTTRDPAVKKTLDTVYDNSVRLNNMIHRTLELQNLEDGGDSLLIMSTFDVVAFCKGIFDVFEENNPGKRFVFHSSYPHLYIEADAVKFESIVTNLLSNACKYSDDGATVSCGIGVTDGNVEITVSDDGVGIADIDQSLVFQRMFRAPSAQKLREGTGLGLYLIKKYLELMKGNIALYSKEGQGTTFVVTLPLTGGGTSAGTSVGTSVGTLFKASHPDGNPSDGKPSDGDSSGKAKILVVEDNLQISSFLTDILRDNYTVFTAENGRSGLAIASSVNPDLIIVDEMMPVMSGLEMVGRIKQHPRLASVPVIMLTAKSDSKTENQSIRLGIDVFMAKPFEPSALTGRIHHLLEGRTEIKEKARIQAIAEAEVKPIEAESVTEKQLAHIAKVIEDNISDPGLNVSLLCEKTGIPNKQLYRLITKYMGIAPLDYIRRVRLQKAAVLLSQHRFTVSEISYMVGFKTPSYFAKCFQTQYGVKPSQYRSEDENVGHK